MDNLRLVGPDEVIEKHGWLKLPVCTLVDNRISVNAKMVLVTILQYAVNGVCTVPKQIIAFNLATSKDTVYRAIGELEKKGYIERRTQWVPELRKKVSVILTRLAQFRALEVATQPECEEMLTFFT